MVGVGLHARRSDEAKAVDTVKELNNYVRDNAGLLERVACSEVKVAPSMSHSQRKPLPKQ